MQIAKLLDLCARKEASLALQNGRLRISTPKGALNEDELLELQRNRRALVRSLAGAETRRLLTKKWKDRLPACHEHAHHTLTPYQDVFHLLSRNQENITVVNQVGVFQLDDLPLKMSDAMHNVFGILMARHEMLRAFCSTPQGGAPLLHISKECAIPLAVHTIPDAHEREKAIAGCVHNFRFTPYDLAAPPLWRAAVFTGQANEAVLVLGLHHLIMDGWSMGVLAREVGALLNAHLQGTEPNLPPLVANYTEYAAWLHASALPAIKERQAAFWRNTLAGIPPRHALQPDFVRGPIPPVPDKEGTALSDSHPRHALCAVDIDAALAKKINSWAARHGCSFFSALHTALRLFLYREEGEAETPILTVVANRPFSGLEDIVGCFVNVLPLVAPFDPQKTAVETLLQSHACLMEALDNQTLPFQDIVAASGVRRHSNRHPVSQIFLTLQNAFGMSGAISMTPRIPDYPISAYDLAFVVWDFGERGHRLHLEYDTALFTRARMEASAAAFLQCLATLTETSGTLEAALNPIYAKAPSRIGAAQKLAELLNFSAYDGIVFEQTAADPDGLLSLAAAESGVPVLASLSKVTASSLVCLTRWPAEKVWPEAAHVCIVNHLPSGLPICGANDNIRLLLQLPETTVFALVDRFNPVEADATVAARLHRDCLPAESAPGGTAAFNPQLRLRLLTRDTVALPLPGYGSPLLWRQGYAVNLNHVASKLTGKSLPELALGIVAPARREGQKSLLHDEGELVAWYGDDFPALSSKKLEEGFTGLPLPLRPQHHMRVRRLPRHADGRLRRDLLQELPLYTASMLQRAFAAGHADLRETAPQPGKHTQIYTPSGPSGMKLAFPDCPAPDWDIPFAPDRCCMVLLSGSDVDAPCIAALLRKPETRLWLYGANAHEVCRLLDQPERLQYGGELPDHTAARAAFGVSPGGLVHILSLNAATIEPDRIAQKSKTAAQTFHAQLPGVPLVRWLIIDTDAVLPAATLFQYLHGDAVRHNTRAPHTDILVAMPLQQEHHMLSMLELALKSGKDALLAGADPSRIGRHLLSPHVPQPSCTLVLYPEAAVVPGRLPHPLCNIWGEPGPYEVHAPSPGTAENTHQSHKAEALRATMANIWAQTLCTDAADPEANFFDLGGTSVMAPQLRERIQQAFGVDMGVAAVFLHPCLSELTDAVLEKLPLNAHSSAPEATPDSLTTLPQNEKTRSDAQRDARKRRKQQASMRP
ncbi:MAG: condensation domain-containing protein [Desulfovibrio sp.]|uniref:condensation domain-containing protein n=1 Tax=Desulfovibrio sp. TaxID=885 RepID=UPI0039E549E8